MPPPVPVTQEPCRGEHRQADPDNEDQMGEINVIFGGSLNAEINLAQCIEAGKKNEVV
jgi:hypothetical protein